LFDADSRKIEAIRLPLWGQVVKDEGAVPWALRDGLGEPVAPVQAFLRDFAARGNAAGSVRSYAMDLLRWWRFLIAVGVAWDQATPAEVRDFVLWFKQATKPVAAVRKQSSATAGMVNPVTRKTYLDDMYKPATIRHSNAVLRSFYDFWIERGAGPMFNPVVRELGRGGSRANAHHNPLQPFRAEGRLRYNPRLPKRTPRMMPDQEWNRLFKELGSNRDRAIVAVGVSCGARASELLGMTGTDIDWGEQLVQVVRKGTRARQWLPVSPDAIVWLRLYLNDIGPIGPSDPVWRTLYRRGGKRQPLNYDALRAVLRRVNAKLGTNWSMHDFRHTAGKRMARDPGLSLLDVQTILGHAHLSTTQIYLDEDDEAVFTRVLAHLAERGKATSAPPPVAEGYDSGDLDILLGRKP
jgi:integrase/recombinase XerD